MVSGFFSCSASTVHINCGVENRLSPALSRLPSLVFPMLITPGQRDIFPPVIVALPSGVIRSQTPEFCILSCHTHPKPLILPWQATCHNQFRNISWRQHRRHIRQTGQPLCILRCLPCDKISWHHAPHLPVYQPRWRFRNLVPFHPVHHLQQLLQQHEQGREKAGKVTKTTVKHFSFGFPELHPDWMCFHSNGIHATPK